MARKRKLSQTTSAIYQRRYRKRQQKAACEKLANPRMYNNTVHNDTPATPTKYSVKLTGTAEEVMQALKHLPENISITFGDDDEPPF